MIKQLFCKHKWNKMSESVIYDSVGIIEGYYQDIKVVLISCENCGTIKRIKIK